MSTKDLQPWQQEMVAAVPTSTIDAIVRDNRAGHRPSSSIAPSTPQPTPTPGSGWAPEKPLTNPPGTRVIEQLLDHADAQDRAKLIQQRAIDAVWGRTLQAQREAEAEAARHCHVGPGDPDHDR